MPWILTDIKSPIPAVVEDALRVVSSGTNAISSSVAAAQTLLDIVKKIYTGTLNPLAALVTEAVTQIELLVNDFFSTGAYVLVIHPWNVTGRTTVDAAGVPMLAPRRVLELAIESFDDEGDANRPLFGQINYEGSVQNENTSAVAAYGFLVTSSDLAQFISILNKLIEVFNIPDLNLFTTRLREQEDATIVPSSPPDWTSRSLRTIGHFKDLNDSFIRQAELLKAYTKDSDSNMSDLVTAIQQRVTILQDECDEANRILNSMRSIAQADGVYFLKVETSNGGNAYLQEQIADTQFDAIATAYSAMILVVGGGVSLKPVETIRDLLT